MCHWCQKPNHHITHTQVKVSNLMRDIRLCTNDMKRKIYEALDMIHGTMNYIAEKKHFCGGDFKVLNRQPEGELRLPINEEEDLVHAYCNYCHAGGILAECRRENLDHYRRVIGYDLYFDAAEQFQRDIGTPPTGEQIEKYEPTWKANFKYARS